MSEKDRQPDDKRERMWIFEREYSRRDVLKGAAALGAAAGLSGILAACGGGSTSSSEGETPATTAAGATTSAAADTGGAETAAAGGPVTGGRLRVGHVGGGKAESFNPATGSTFIDASRYYNLYDPLVRVSPELENQPGLALEWNANSDSTAVRGQAPSRCRLAQRQGLHRRRRHLHARPDERPQAHRPLERVERPCG